MGIFSNKTEIVLGTQIESLFGEEDLPHTWKSATAQYLNDVEVQNMLSLDNMDYLQYFFENSLVRKLETSYNWTATRYKYAYLYDNVIGTDPLTFESKLKEFAISKGHDVQTVLFSGSGTLHPYMATLVALQDKYGFNMGRNTLDTLTAFHGNATTFLEDAKVKYSREYVNNILYNYRADSRVYIDDGSGTLVQNTNEPTPVFEINALNLAELIQTEVSFQSGQTFDRAYSLNRGSTVYEIPSYTGGDWRTMEEPYPNVYHPTGTLENIEVDVSVVFQIKTSTVTKEVTTYTYIDPDDHSQGYENPVVSTSTTETTDPVSPNIPSDAILYSTSTEPTTSTTTTNETYNNYIVTVTTTETKADKYRRVITIDINDYVYSGFISYDPTVCVYHKLGFTVNLDILKPEFLQLYYLNSYGEREIYAINIDSGEANEFLDTITYISEIGHYYATLPVKHGNDDMRELDKTDEDYIAFKKWGKKLGMDWMEVVESLYDSLEDNLDKIKNSYISFSVGVDAEDIESRTFLYEYFNDLFNTLEQSGTVYAFSDVFTKKVETGVTLWLYDEDGNRIPDSAYQETITMKMINGDGEQFNDGNPFYGGVALDLSDGYIDKKFEFMFIHKAVKQGVLTANATYSSNFTDETYNLVNLDHEPESSTVIPSKQMNRKVWQYMKQTSDTEYTILSVFEPTYAHTIIGREYWHTVDLRSKDAVPIVPLDRRAKAIMSKFNDREALYSRNCKLVLGTLVKTETKWYETGLFKLVITAIIVIISYYFPPASGLLANTVSAMAGAAIGSSAYAAAYAVIMVTTSIALQAIQRSLGNSVLGKLLSIAMIAYSMYTLSTSLVNTSATQLMRGDLLTFLGRAGNIYNKIQQQLTGNLEGELIDEYGVYQEQMSELEKLNEQFSNITSVDTYSSPIASGYLVVGDTLDRMVERTVSVNQGQVAIDYISNFVENSLRLPELDESIQKKILEQEKERG